MAEERLIDDDKDRKYRVVKNPDGEDELVIDDSKEPAAQAEEEEVSFDAPEEYAQNQEEEILTPEQLAALREREEKEKRERALKAEDLLRRASKDCAANKFATALEYLEKAEELDSGNGEIYALRLSAYTRNFTDYSQIAEASGSVNGLTEHTSAERKAELFAKSSVALEENIASLRSKVSAMNAENEAKKAERAVRFKRDMFISIAAALVAAGVLAVFIWQIFFNINLIYTVSTNKYVVLAGVFGGLSFIMLIGLAFALRWVNITCRRVVLNRRNTSTKLGRDLLAEQAKLKAFLAVYTALKG